jgi:hypothetical protein
MEWAAGMSSWNVLRDASYARWWYCCLAPQAAACVTRCCLQGIIYKDDSGYLDRENKQVVSDQFTVFFIISQQ